MPYALNSQRTAWDQSPNLSMYVAEATRRGLTVDACRQLLAQTPSAPTDNLTALPDRALCVNAVDDERGAGTWNQNPTFSTHVAEAIRRGLTVYSCNLLLSQPLSPPTSSSPESEQGKFLEAALFFITGVDTAKEDTVTNREIVLDRYPIVAYLVGDNACAERIRHTETPYWVLQMDFCKITDYQKLYGAVRWYGYKSAMCFYYGWDKNENYFGPINVLNSKRCSVYEYTSEDRGSRYTAWTSGIDINGLLPVPGQNQNYTPRRSEERMVASFKYIVTLLTPPEQRKPY